MAPNPANAGRAYAYENPASGRLDTDGCGLAFPGRIGFECGQVFVSPYDPELYDGLLGEVVKVSGTEAVLEDPDGLSFAVRRSCMFVEGQA